MPPVFVFSSVFSLSLNQQKGKDNMDTFKTDNELTGICRKKIIHDYYGRTPWFETDLLIHILNQKGKKPVSAIDIHRNWNLTFYKEWYW